MASTISAFEALFTKSAPVVFAYHGYRWAIHSMLHGRPNEARFHVRGFIRIRSRRTDITDLMGRKLYDHNAYIREHFEDMRKVALWRWTPDLSESTNPLPLAKGQPQAQLFTDGMSCSGTKLGAVLDGVSAQAVAVPAQRGRL